MFTITRVYFSCVGHAQLQLHAGTRLVERLLPRTFAVIEKKGQERWQTMSLLPTFHWPGEPVASPQLNRTRFYNPPAGRRIRVHSDE